MHYHTLIQVSLTSVWFCVPLLVDNDALKGQPNVLFLNLVLGGVESRNQRFCSVENLYLLISSYIA